MLDLAAAVVGEKKRESFSGEELRGLGSFSGGRGTAQSQAIRQLDPLGDIGARPLAAMCSAVERDGAPDIGAYERV